MAEVLRVVNLAKRVSENKILLMSLFFVSAVIFLLVFSWSTSPFFTFYGYDSSIFRSMGRFTAEGLIPYRDFFDHKGPFVIFIEYIGYGIFKSDYTLLLLQAIFMTASLFGIYKIARLFLNNKKSIILTFVSLAVCTFYISGQGGNSVEEWILPFLVWSSYFAVRFFAYKEKEHSFKCSILYGITFAIAAFSRLTNALPILILALIILIYLIKQKAWANIFKNILAVIIGALIITVPIFIWFIANGELKEMLYATFIFNFKYMKARSLVPDVMRILRHTARYLLPIIFAVVLQVAMIIKKKDVWLNVALLIQSIVAVAMQVTSALFPHYLIIWIPTIVITLILAVKDSGAMKWLVRGYALVLVVVFAASVYLPFKRYNDYLKDIATKYERACKDIGEHIPDKSKNILSVNNNPYIYLATDIKPCYKYFHTQDLHSSYDAKTKAEWDKLIQSNKADYMIVNKMADYPVYKYLKKNYKSIYQNDYLILIEKK